MSDPVSATPKVDALATLTRAVHGVPTTRELFEQADQMLFDASVAALHTKTKKDREYVDRLITEARVKIETLRRRVS